MGSGEKYERGHTAPFMTLNIFVIIAILAYLGFDSMNPENPSTGSIYTTWLGWPWWARVLSIAFPVALLLVGSRLDNASRIGKLPPQQ